MDEFAHLSRENFEVFQRYNDTTGPDPKYRSIVIFASPDAPTTYIEKDLDLDDLLGFFKARPALEKESTAAAGAASLKMVAVDSRLESWSNFFTTLFVTKDVFLGLVDSMAMHPAALWLLRYEYDGFHHFGGPEVDTFYIGTSNFVLIWTFDHRTLCTRAIWIMRQVFNSAPVAWFQNILRRHQEHVYSPFLLAYVTALSVCSTFDSEISYRAHVVRLTERQTGYSTHSSSIEQRLGMESLTVSIKEVGEVLNHVANNGRHFRMIDTILDSIMAGVGGVDGLSPGARGRMEKSTFRLVATIPSIRSRMHASQEYLQYLKERAERLSTVLFALLTHEDSAIHAELADASRRIAEASKRDSSSMKTVAIMTMAFLPATFFAALFSVPSLDWDGDSVIKNNFWIYWAFTLPATGIVFLLWLLLDNRTSIMGRRKDEVLDGKSE
ncbi:hypothetical protein F4779DRAFT_632557 [Xylariaceae sp. FL0662B]|nr:hypothetical protein F4779DRAFT_632557 [Xylariaceae sp. FL0662B]